MAYWYNQFAQVSKKTAKPPKHQNKEIDNKKDIISSLLNHNKKEEEFLTQKKQKNL